MTEEKDQKPDPQRVAALRSLPLEIKEQITGEEADAMMKKVIPMRKSYDKLIIDYYKKMAEQCAGAPMEEMFKRLYHGRKTFTV